MRTVEKAGSLVCSCCPGGTCLATAEAAALGAWAGPPSLRPAAPGLRPLPCPGPVPLEWSGDLTVALGSGWAQSSERFPF